ncbi:crotonase/enoyl-CoA hydratase family protein [Oceanicella sp. SM1341]|uniref:crotonase/enoyl-CoA hydratase family protein n=1 Tax=Oceanicella sp. SM1341 TaxID=1548889 RepID=UPI000E53CBD5|nr:crotonase/enoyl-CoA hydratase family protein [Oceanicella sp. SM1341]
MSTIRIETDARGVATLTLTRPDKHNAISAEMMSDLASAAESLGMDSAVRVVVLAGEGASFCAGGDLTWMKEQFAASRKQREKEGRRLARTFGAFNDLPKPLIARVHGAAYGGGLGLISVCDMVVAAEEARFGFTETRLGLIPATISPYVIARMGEGRARQVFMSSRIFGPEEAVALGLVGRVVPAPDLDAAIEAEVAPYLSVAPEAVAASKALARSLGPVIDDAVIDDTIRRLADTWEGAEAQEGVGAFLARRKPSWKA